MRLAGLALGLALLGWPAAANPPELAMLAGLQKGKWDVRIRNGATRSVCVRSGPEFIQLQHRETGCSRFIVADTPTEVRVQYTCPGNGYGLTHVRKESARLVQIQSQGIHNGEPFDFSAEGRHAGAC
jgi:hypothetical protein